MWRLKDNVGYQKQSLSFEMGLSLISESQVFKASAAPTKTSSHTTTLRLQLPIFWLSTQMHLQAPQKIPPLVMFSVCHVFTLNK